jgi:hypothetical protein
MSIESLLGGVILGKETSAASLGGKKIAVLREGGAWLGLDGKRLTDKTDEVTGKRAIYRVLEAVAKVKEGDVLVIPGKPERMLFVTEDQRGDKPIEGIDLDGNGVTWSPMAKHGNSFLVVKLVDASKEPSSSVKALARDAQSADQCLAVSVLISMLNLDLKPTRGQDRPKKPADWLPYLNWETLKQQLRGETLERNPFGQDAEDPSDAEQIAKAIGGLAPKGG